MEIRELQRTLQEESKAEVEEISKMALGEDATTKTVSGAMAMTDRVIKIEELKIEEQKIEIEKEKIEVEKKRINGEKFVSILKTVGQIGLGVASIAVGLVINSKSIDREMNEGIIHSSTAGRENEKKLLGLWNIGKPNL
jgi:hypothetical protein